MIRAWPRYGTNGGYALAEVTLALVVMGFIGALALPALPQGGSTSNLRAAAYQLAALLRDERTRAASTGQIGVVRLDTDARQLGAKGSSMLTLPAGIGFAGGSEIMSLMTFTPDGHSSGGTIVLQGRAAQMAVIVNPDTGAISFAAR